jgi:hypothetical protein
VRATKRRDTTTPTSLLRAAVEQLHHHSIKLLTVALLDKPTPAMGRSGETSRTRSLKCGARRSGDRGKRRLASRWGGGRGGLTDRVFWRRSTKVEGRDQR